MLFLQYHEFDSWMIESEIFNLMVEYFMNLHMILLSSSSEGMWAQDSIPETRDFLINDFLACGYKHK